MKTHYGTFDLQEEETSTPLNVKTTSNAKEISTPAPSTGYSLLNFFSYDNLKDTAQIFKDTIMADIFGDVAPQSDREKSAAHKP